MKRNLVFLVAVVGLSVQAEPSGDRPDSRHAWAVHDVNRPDPVKIEAKEGAVPSDAIVLFDGSAESAARHWRAADGGETKWTVVDGAFVCTPGSGFAVTKETFEDIQLHIEWKAPKDDLYGWGNSGVYVGGVYEIQILDSYAIVPSRSPFKPANYADGQAGAVYGQSPCLVNPSRPAGEWQSFDIVFHPPRYEHERLVDPGDVTVFFNGVLVQDAWKLEGPTRWCRRAKASPVASADVAQPVKLQDHGHPVPFRNIWVRRIPSRTANVVSGGEFVKRGEVAKLRHRLAGESRAAARQTDDPAEKFIRLWESFCYEPDGEVRKEIDGATARLIAALEAKDPRVVDRARFGAIKRFVKMLVLGRWIEAGTPLEKAVDAFQAPPKPTAAHLRDI